MNHPWMTVMRWPGPPAGPRRIRAPGALIDRAGRDHGHEGEETVSDRSRLIAAAIS